MCDYGFAQNFDGFDRQVSRPIAAVQTFGHCHTQVPLKALKFLDRKENDRTVLISAGALLTNGPWHDAFGLGLEKSADFSSGYSSRTRDSAKEGEVLGSYQAIPIFISMTR